MLSNNLHAALPDINIYENKPLSSLCTLGVGGNAEVFAAPESIEDMRRLFSFLMNEGCNVYIIGGGSNVLFPDGTISGAVISTKNLKALKWLNPNTAEIYSGVNLSAIMKELNSHKLGGFEFTAGIPGTLGGALSGNAGAGGHGVCELADEVLSVEADGSLRIWRNDEINYSYRRCSLSEGRRVILSARMRFRDSRPEDKAALDDFMMKRSIQPHGLKNAGCTFKNPEGYSAGKLLDQCGCKGISIGDAFVSEQHANFILNRGNAKAGEIIELIELCSRKVYDCTGIKLEPEIKIMNPCFFV